MASSNEIMPVEIDHSRDDLLFDYASLDDETSLFLQTKAREIKKRVRRVIQDIIDIGQYLIEVKAKLGHGFFINWIEVEFEWSISTAVRYMRAARRFENVNLTNLNILTTAIYYLSEPNTPEDVAFEAVERAKKGEKITYEVSKQIRAEYEQKQPKSIKQQVSDSTPDPVEESGEIVSSSSKTELSPSKSKQQILSVYPSNNAVKDSWWQLGEKHWLFCGEPNSTKFIERVPKKIALTLSFPPNRDYSLIPDLKSRSNFSYASKYKAFDLSLVVPMVRNAIELSTEEGETITFLYISHPVLLELGVRLGCQCYVVEPDLEKCNQILKIWRKDNSVSRLTS